MFREDPEAFLRELAAPLSEARQGGPLPGIPFSPEAVANAFVMLGLLPEQRAEEILAEHRLALEAKGFRFGVLTGELSVRSGAHGFQDAQEASQESLAQIPLAVAAGPVPLPVGGVDLTLEWAVLTRGGVKLVLHSTGQLDDNLSGPGLRLYWVLPSRPPDEKIRSGLLVTDNLGRQYRMQPGSWCGTNLSRRPGGPLSWDGEMLAEPEPRAEPVTSGAVRWLEFAAASAQAARVIIPAPDQVAAGAAEPPWPTPAECYLAALAKVTSMSIGTDGRTVELDVAQIVAAVAEALLWTGALPPDSALLSGGTTATADPARWREPLAHGWGARAWRRASEGEPVRAGLAVRLPLRQATAVIEGVTAHEDLVWIQLYGHPWVMGAYWPMITPCFQVRAVDDTGGEHDGMPGSGGGSPEGSHEFWFWPPVPLTAKKLRVIVSTLWEAAWAEIDIPGRP